MLISLFAAMGLAMNAETIEYTTDDGFEYKLDTETKTAELARYSGSANEVTIPESVTYSDMAFAVTSLGEYCFYYYRALTSITIPSSVTSLGEGCFYGCSALTSIDIPSSVTSLGEGCFASCTSLTSIDIPSSVTSLGECCFFYCTSLTSIDIPSSVTNLGERCFSNCKSIKTMTCEIPTAIAVGDEFFFRVPIYDATLYVPEASLDSYKATSPCCYFGTILPIAATGIEKNTFSKSNAIDAIYSLEGKRTNGARRGMNIIRKNDGTTRKVMKK